MTDYRINDQAGCLATLGLLFVGSGTLAIILGISADGSPLARTAAIAIGLAHIAGGLYTFRNSPFRDVRINAERRELIITTRGWGGVTRRVIPGNEVSGGRLQRDVDSDGDPVFTPQIKLHSGEWLPLVLVPRQSAELARSDLQLVYRHVLGRAEIVDDDPHSRNTTSA